MFRPSWISLRRAPYERSLQIGGLLQVICPVRKKGTEEKSMLKKSYKGLILWMAGYTAVLTGAAFLPTRDVGLLVRVIDNLTMVSIVVLMLIIWKTEKVFWFSGMSFEQAVEAGSDRRKAYSWRHVKLFGIFAAAYFLFSVAAQLLHFPFAVDFAVLTAGAIAASIFSMKIKL